MSVFLVLELLYPAVELEPASVFFNSSFFSKNQKLHLKENEYKFV